MLLLRLASLGLASPRAVAWAHKRPQRGAPGQVANAGWGCRDTPAPGRGEFLSGSQLSPLDSRWEHRRSGTGTRGRPLRIGLALERCTRRLEDGCAGCGHPCTALPSMSSLCACLRDWHREPPMQFTKDVTGPRVAATLLVSNPLVRHCRFFRFQHRPKPLWGDKNISYNLTSMPWRIDQHHFAMHFSMCSD